jgi:hypothetical protein
MTVAVTVTVIVAVTIATELAEMVENGSGPPTTG